METNAACQCSSLDILDSQILEASHSLLDAVRDELNYQNYSDNTPVKSVISYQGMVGAALTLAKRGEETSVGLIAIPRVFGTFISVIDMIEPPILGGTVSLKFKALLLLAGPQGRQRISSADILMQGPVEEPKKLTIQVSNVEEPPGPNKRSYDWKCLLRCAPACLTCFGSSPNRVGEFA
jgi:hypothetical protein